MMERSRSRLDPLSSLQVRDRDLQRQVDRLRNSDMSLPDWLEIGTAIAPAFQNSWVQYNSNDATYAHSGFWRTSSGLVVMRGLISSGTLGTPAFVLPTGFRPTRALVFSTVANDAFASMRIFADGTVQPQTGSNVWFSIACCFRAEQ